MTQKKKQSTKRKTNPDIENGLAQMGRRIKKLRIEQGYSAAEYFAYDHNIARAQYARYEQGEDLRLSTLIRIVKAFDMSLTEFFSEGFED